MRFSYIEIEDGGASIEVLRTIEDLIESMGAQPHEAEEIRAWAEDSAEGSVLSWRMGWVFRTCGRHDTLKAKWKSKP
jgi:hypothetical protein